MMQTPTSPLCGAIAADEHAEALEAFERFPGTPDVLGTQMQSVGEAMAIRGRMSLAASDRLFPSKDVLPVGGFGNLIAAPLQGTCRRRGTTVFLDLAKLQWRILAFCF